MAEEGQVIAVHKEAEWREHFEKGKASGKLVVVDFTASWCPPCRFIAPVFVDLAKSNPDVIFLKVDVDELQFTLSLQVISKEWDVKAMPTFLFLKGGEKVHEIVGAIKDELIATVAKLKVDNTATSTATA